MRPHTSSSHKTRPFGRWTRAPNPAASRLETWQSSWHPYPRQRAPNLPPLRAKMQSQWSILRAIFRISRFLTRLARHMRHQNGASSRHFKDEAGAPRADALPRVENEKREHEPDASRANYPRKSGGNATIRPKLPQNCHKTRRSPKKHRKEPTWLSARASASPRAPGRRVA